MIIQIIDIQNICLKEESKYFLEEQVALKKFSSEFLFLFIWNNPLQEICLI